MHMVHARPYESALALHDECLRRMQTRPVDGDATDLFLRSSVTPGIYEHFKSTENETKYYAVFGVARKVNRPEGEFDSYDYHVAYQALYPPHAYRFASRELVCPDGFLMPIKRPTYEGIRFTLIEPCDVGRLQERARFYERI